MEMMENIVAKLDSLGYRLERLVNIVVMLTNNLEKMD